MKKIFITALIILIAGLLLLSVTIAAAYTGTAKLSWTGPTQFVDGTPLVPATDLSGFKIYSGTASGVYGTPVLVSSPTATTYTMTIGEGTTYFAVAAIGKTGIEGLKSNEASKTITAPAPGGCSLTVK